MSKNYEKLSEALQYSYDVLKSEQNKIKEALHYPDCWDTINYPTLLDAIKEVGNCNPDCCTKTK